MSSNATTLAIVGVAVAAVIVLVIVLVSTTTKKKKPAPAAPLPDPVSPPPQPPAEQEEEEETTITDDSDTAAHTTSTPLDPKKSACCAMVPKGKCVAGCPPGDDGSNQCSKTDPSIIPYANFYRENCAAKFTCCDKVPKGQCVAGCPPGDGSNQCAAGDSSIMSYEDFFGKNCEAVFNCCKSVPAGRCVSGCPPDYKKGSNLCLEGDVSIETFSDYSAKNCVQKAIGGLIVKKTPGTTTAKECRGFVCDVEGQYCPPGVPGSAADGSGYCCKNKKWVAGKCSPAETPCDPTIVSAPCFDPIAAFNKIGCPNKAPPQKTIDYWAKQADKGLADMYDYCVQSRDKTWTSSSPLGFQKCCGADGGKCTPVCKRLSKTGKTFDLPSDYSKTAKGTDGKLCHLDPYNKGCPSLSAAAPAAQPTAISHPVLAIM